MVTPSPILCIFLMSCLTKPLKDFKDCPDSCICYTAPKSKHRFQYKNFEL